jgi:hypothetical protein
VVVDLAHHKPSSMWDQGTRLGYWEENGWTTKPRTTSRGSTIGAGDIWPAGSRNDHLLGSARCLSNKTDPLLISTILICIKGKRHQYHRGIFTLRTHTLAREDKEMGHGEIVESLLHRHDCTPTHTGTGQ